MGHFNYKPFLRRGRGVQVEVGPGIIIAGVGQPGVRPVPVPHGVLQPVEVRPTPDVELPTVLEYCREQSLG